MPCRIRMENLIMTTTIDTLKLKRTDQVYYIGKFGTPAGWGTIVKVEPAKGHHPLAYTVDMGEDYPDKLYRKMSVPHYCMKPGIGQVFKTVQQWEQERDDANVKLNAFYKSFNRNPLGEK